MQTNNIQPGLAVKTVAKSGSNSPASGLLGPSAAENGFSSWLQQSSGSAVTNGRSESKVLPQEGSESPVKDLRDNSAPLQQSSNSEESNKVESTAKSAEIGQVDAGQSSGAEAARDGVANASDAPVETGVAPSLQADETAQNASTVAVVDVELSADSNASSTVTSSGVQSSLAAPESGQAVEQFNQQNQVTLDSSGTKDAEGLLAGSSKTPDHAQAGGLINTDTPPPGIVHASPQGLAHGRAFQNANVESAQPVTTGQTDTLVSGEAVQLADTVNASNQTEAPVGSVFAADATGEPSGAFQDSEALIASQIQSEIKEASVPVTELDHSVQAQTADAPMAPEQVVASDISPPQVSAEVVPAQEIEAELKAQSAMIAPLNDSESSVEINPALASAQPVTNAQPINAPSNGQTATGQNSGASLATPAGPSGQMTAQTTEQLLQSASSKGMEGAVKAEGPSSATTAPTVASAATTPLVDTGLKPQAALATAVPPQALNRLQQEQWGQRLGERALMMVQQGPRVAYVQLDPPELGALQVRVHLGQGDQVSLNFTVPNAAVRDVLEQHLPRLREMFAEQGLNLAQSDVRDQSAGGQDRGDGGSSRRGEQYAGSAEEPDLSFSELRVPVGMVDFYA